jgi:hypothetical protein
MRRTIRASVGRVGRCGDLLDQRGGGRGLKPRQVGLGQDADKLAGLDHGHMGDALFHHRVQDVGDQRGGGQGDRVAVMTSATGVSRASPSATARLVMSPVVRMPFTAPPSAAMMQETWISRILRAASISGVSGTQVSGSRVISSLSAIVVMSLSAGAGGARAIEEPQHARVFGHQRVEGRGGDAQKLTVFGGLGGDNGGAVLHQPTLAEGIPRTRGSTGQTRRGP